MTLSRTQAMRLLSAAYEQGWRDACDDGLAQDKDPSYPIGRSKRTLTSVAHLLDPHNVLGIRSGGVS